MKHSFLFFICLLLNTSAFSQVGMGTTTPHVSAALDVESTTKGFLPPRLTTLQRNGISSPVAGLTIFNTDVNCLQWYNASGWYNACDGFIEFLGGGFTNGFEANTTCSTKVISVTSCASVAGATINDDLGTADGTEYDWSEATGFVDGGATQALVEIGGQCWYRRNAVNTPSAYSPAPTWVNFSDVGWSGYYNNTPQTNEGKFYQWSAAMNGSITERAQGICPNGWHVPSDCEWMFLENSLGMSVTEQIKNNETRSTTGEGAKLKSGGSSGFIALLAGSRSIDGQFVSRGAFGNWWSSSEVSATKAWRRYLHSPQDGVIRRDWNKVEGFSVRCLKD